MAVVYQSTMQSPLGEPAEPMTPEQIESLRNPMLAQRNRDLEAIAERRAEELEKSPSAKHDEAVKNFDYAYKDVVTNPALLHEVVRQRNYAIERAQQRGEVVDWSTTLPEIGEKVRKLAGLPSGKEREHFDWLDEMRASRGQRSR